MSDFLQVFFISACIATLGLISIEGCKTVYKYDAYKECVTKTTDHAVCAAVLK